MTNENLEHVSYIPYDTSLKDLAKVNRKNSTEAENKMWNEVLKNRQFEGLKFHRQKPIERYIADFYCPKLMLVIEIDGGSHLGEASEEYDENRTIDLEQYGIKVIRYTNNQVLNSIEDVKKDLLKKIKKENKKAP
jgi:very-short-patch-repair endonuclease